MSSSKVIELMISKLEEDEYEMHIGLTKEIYEFNNNSTQEALLFVNGITGE